MQLNNITQKKFSGKIGLLILSVFGLLVIRELPYFNLFITALVIALITYLEAIFLFSLSGKSNIVIGLVVLVFSLPWLLVGNRIDADGFAIFSFTAFLIGFLQESWRLRNNI